MSNESVIQQAIQDATAPQLVEVTEGDYQALKQAAQAFLNRVNEISDLGFSISRYNSLADQISNFYTFMRQSTAFTREALTLQHTFETQLNQFLGRTIYLTYVNRDGSLYFYDEAHTGELYSKATRNRGRGNIGKTKMFDSQDLEKELQARMNQSAAQRQAVYGEAIHRWEKNKNEDVMHYDPSYHTFYWRLKNTHYIQGWTDPIATRGVIAEGYARAVINEAPDVSNIEIESSLQALWHKYIYADSVAGALIGDVIFSSQDMIDQYGNLQFAIKSGSFSTANFGQFLRLASNIIQVPNLTLQEFKDNFKTLINIGAATDAFINSARQTAENKTTKQTSKNIKINLNI